MRDLLNEAAGKASGDPQKAAQEAMRKPLPKRFYQSASVARSGEGFAVQLDGKPVRTPARKPMILPSEAAAAILAAEWEAQETQIDPVTMPATRLVNTAIDGVASDPQSVFEDIVRFAANDLLFYRATHPSGLVENQRRKWDPLLDWASGFGARFETGEGVMHVEQDRQSVAAFSARLALHGDPLKLACLHSVTTLTGSAIIALALAEGAITAEEGWQASHVDEDWNIAHWGEDHEARVRREYRHGEFLAALAILGAL